MSLPAVVENRSLDFVDFFVVAKGLSEDRQVEVHKFPRGPEDHVDALSGIVQKVSEDNSQALQGISFDVEHLLRV
jgi:hypothetical protein